MRNAFFIVLAFMLLLSACKKESTTPVELTLQDGVFIVNQGSFTVGNSSLSYFQTTNNETFQNVFSAVNNVPLGDVAQSIFIDENTAYIVVNNSGLVYAIDRWTALYKGTIDSLASPRNFLKVSDTKAYVTDLFSNSISIVNPQTYSKTGEIKVDRSTEEMAMVGSEVFVANWSGYNQSLKNNKILVVNSGNDQVVDSIQVGVEPNSMVVDKNNNLWVLCSGGFENEEIPSLWKIDPASHHVIDTLIFPELELNPVSLEISGAGDTLFYLNYGVYKMAITDTQLPESVFIPENSGRYFLTLGVDPSNGNLFISNPLDYFGDGLVYRFDKYGNYKEQFGVGIIPGAFGFNY
jgi:YVTN family beta-propeller protein